jgi:cardiolipin synthase
MGDMGSMFAWIGPVITLLDILLILTLVPKVFLQRKEPQATIAWLFAIIFLPIIGSIVYLAFGNDRMARKRAKQRERSQRTRSLLPAVVGNLDSAIDQVNQLQLYKILNRLNPYPPVQGNRVDILTDMDANFRAQLDAIRSARRHVHLEYYIFRPDEIGERFSDAMIEAARRGVDVRFLYDAVGGMTLTSSFFRKLEQEGVAVARHIPMNLFTRRWIFNFRNHRKILVVDGEVAFMGGANIGEEYLGRSSIGKWFDLHLKIEGPAVQHLQRIFADDWAFAGGHAINGEGYFDAAKPQGDIAAQVVPGGPDAEHHILHEVLFAAITGAVERVRLMTPYFVPTEPLRVALETAGRRGVDVRIMVPKISTKNIVKFASHSYFDELLAAGIKIDEYQPGFLHAKMMTVDGRWALVGTPNFDARSLKLNFEVALSIYDAEIADSLDNLYEQLREESVPINPSAFEKRSVLVRVVENFARLFSPIL